PQWMHWSKPRSCSKLFMQHEGISQDHNHSQAKQWDVFPAKSAQRRGHDAKSKENTQKSDRGRSRRAKRKRRGSDRYKQYQRRDLIRLNQIRSFGLTQIHYRKRISERRDFPSSVKAS